MRLSRAASEATMNTRNKYSADHGFKQATLEKSENIPICVDNIVCFECGKALLDVEHALVSSPKRKGIIIFSCRAHVSNAMNFLAKAFPGDIQPVPENLIFPKIKDN